MFVLELLAGLWSHVKRQRKTKIVEDSIEKENIKSSFLTCGVEVASWAQNLIRRLDARETLGLNKNVEVMCIEVVFNIR